MDVRSDTLRRYLDLLLETLDENVQGDELARRAYLSRFHFDRLLRSAMGEPPGALRRRLLLERAAFHLVRSDASATAIAFEAGYDSLGAFTRAFGRAFGEPPSGFRARAPATYWLSAPNGVHFYPPATLMVPNDRRRTSAMDVTERLIAHDLWLVEQLLEAATALPAEALDRPLDLGETTVSEVDDATLRGLLDHLVFSKETWTGGMTGRPLPGDGPRDTTIAGMRTRLAAIGPTFLTVARGIRDRGEWDAAFIDTSCDPPESFTYGGAIAHVLTFSAHRRELAIGALRSLGATDLDYGDPITWERKASTA